MVRGKLNDRHAMGGSGIVDGVVDVICGIRDVIKVARNLRRFMWGGGLDSGRMQGRVCQR